MSLANLILSGRAGASTPARLILITPKQFLPCASWPHGNIFVLHNSGHEICKICARPHSCFVANLMSTSVVADLLCLRVCVQSRKWFIYCAHICTCRCLCHRCQPPYSSMTSWHACKLVCNWSDSKPLCILVCQCLVK